MVYNGMYFCRWLFVVEAVGGEGLVLVDKIEGTLGDDDVANVKAFEDAKVAFVDRLDFDKGATIGVFANLKEYITTLFTLKNSIFRNDEAVMVLDMHTNLRIHIGEHEVAGVVAFDDGLDGAGFGVEDAAHV